MISAIICLFFAVCDYNILIMGAHSDESKGIVNYDVINNLKLELNQHTWQNVLEQPDVITQYNDFIRDYQYTVYT